MGFIYWFTKFSSHIFIFVFSKFQNISFFLSKEEILQDYFKFSIQFKTLSSELNFHNLIHPSNFQSFSQQKKSFKIFLQLYLNHKKVFF